MSSLVSYSINLEGTSKSSKSSKKSSSKSKKPNFSNADVAHQVITSWYDGLYAHRGFYRIGNDQLTIATVLQDPSGHWMVDGGVDG